MKMYRNSPVFTSGLFNSGMVVLQNNSEKTERHFSSYKMERSSEFLQHRSSLYGMMKKGGHSNSHKMDLSEFYRKFYG